MLENYSSRTKVYPVQNKKEESKMLEYDLRNCAGKKKVFLLYMIFITFISVYITFSKSILTLGKQIS